MKRYWVTGPDEVWASLSTFRSLILTKWFTLQVSVDAMLDHRRKLRSCIPGSLWWCTPCYWKWRAGHTVWWLEIIWLLNLNTITRIELANITVGISWRVLIHGRTWESLAVSLTRESAAVLHLVKLHAYVITRSHVKVLQICPPVMTLQFRTLKLWRLLIKRRCLIWLVLSYRYRCCKLSIQGIIICINVYSRWSIVIRRPIAIEPDLCNLNIIVVLITYLVRRLTVPHIGLRHVCKRSWLVQLYIIIVFTSLVLFVSHIWI